MNQNKFQPDKKLFTLCIYALITTVVAVFFIRCIWNWSETKSLLLSFGAGFFCLALGVSMPGLIFKSRMMSLLTRLGRH